MIDTFFDGLDVLYRHAKFGGDRTTVVGAKIWCLYVVFLSRSEAGALFVRGGIF